MADELGKGTDSERSKAARLSRVEQATATAALAVVLLTFALVLTSRLSDPPWIFVGQLIALALIFCYALRHDAGASRRVGLAVVGGFMLWWAFAVIAGVHHVTPFAAVVTATGAALIGSLVWGVVSGRPLRHPRPPG